MRVALRAEARQLGGFERLVEECAYEQWHRMLFARFLAENDLLIHPEHGVAVVDGGVRGARARPRGQRIPGCWRAVRRGDAARDLPAGRSRPAGARWRRRTSSALEAILAGLPAEVFTSDDALGWVYQFWQAKRKKEVNASERKIGGADIAPGDPALHRALHGPRSCSRTRSAPGGRPPSRRARSSRSGSTCASTTTARRPPAPSRAGPSAVAEVTVMDPCCGSGHFLVAAVDMLRKMRMEEEGLTAAAGRRRGLARQPVRPRARSALHPDRRVRPRAAGLEDGRLPQLPVPNIACSGISVKGQLDDWKKLAGGDERLEQPRSNGCTTSSRTRPSSAA